MSLARPLAQALAALLIATGGARAQTPDPLDVLEQAVANTQTLLQGEGPVDAVYLQAVETDNGDERQSRVLRIDTRKPLEDQVELVEVDGKPADAETRAAYRAERIKRIEEAREASADEDDDEEQESTLSISFGNIDTHGARLISRADGTMRFELPNGAPAMTQGEAAEMAKHLTMEVEVVTTGPHAPYFGHMRAFNEESFKPGLIGKVKRFEMEFDLTLNEQPKLLLITEMNIALRARALFRKIESNQRVAYTDHQFHAVAPEGGSGEGVVGDQ